MPSFYELLFGEIDEPGSANALTQLLDIPDCDYNELNTWLTNLRSKVAGAAQPEKLLSQKLQEAELKMAESFDRKDYQKTVDCGIQAASLRGGFTEEVCITVVNSLLKIGRSDFAVAICFSAMESEPGYGRSKHLVNLLCEAYFIHGYENIYGMEIGFMAMAFRSFKRHFWFEPGRPKWSFDDADIERTVDCLMLIEDKDDWMRNLYPINHIRLHLRLRDADSGSSKALLSSRVNFAKRVKFCSAIMNLLRRANVETLQLDETLFLASFCSVFVHLFEKNASFAGDILAEDWYRDFVTSFSSSLVSVGSAERLARVERGFSCQLLHAFLKFSLPYLREMFEREDITLTKPFNEFSWYSKAMMIPAIAGCGTTQLCSFRNWSKVLVWGLVKNLSKKSFRLQVADSSQESVIKSLDVLYLVAQVSSLVSYEPKFNLKKMVVSVLRSCLIFKTFNSFDFNSSFVSTFGFLFNHLSKLKTPAKNAFTNEFATVLGVTADLLDLMLQKESSDASFCVLSKSPEVVTLINKLSDDSRVFSNDREVLAFVKSLQAKCLQFN